MSDCYFPKKTVNLLKKFKKIRYILNELEAGSTFNMGTWPSDLTLSKAETVVEDSPRSERLKIQVWISRSKKRRRGRVNYRFRWR